MAYWRLAYHIVWATKERLPLIAPEIEMPVYRALAHKCEELDAVLFAVNGMPDHVHVVAAVKPTLALSEFVKQLKGSSSRFVHLEYELPFQWQRGYGIFSISDKLISTAVDYVRHQKQHHAAGSDIPAYERIESADLGPERTARFPTPYLGEG